jgi:hypothetical protein
MGAMILGRLEFSAVVIGLAKIMGDVPALITSRRSVGAPSPPEDWSHEATIQRQHTTSVTRQPQPLQLDRRSAPGQKQNRCRRHEM